MAHDVFICHSTKDRPTITRVLVPALEKAGLRCWIAPRDIPDGADWPSAIERAVGAASAFVIVVSESSNVSGHVQNEANAAFDAKLPLFPLFIHTLELSPGLKYFLRSAQWRMAVTPPLEDHMPEFVRAVKAAIRRDGPATVGVRALAAPVVTPSPPTSRPAATTQDLGRVMASAVADRSPSPAAAPRGDVERATATATAAPAGRTAAAIPAEPVRRPVSSYTAPAADPPWWLTLLFVVAGGALAIGAIIWGCNWAIERYYAGEARQASTDRFKAGIQTRKLVEANYRPSGTYVEPATGRVVDLLALVDVGADAAGGAWRRESYGLEGRAAGHGATPVNAGETAGIGKLVLPYRPPEAYDLRIKFSCLAPAQVSGLGSRSGAVLIEPTEKVGSTFDLIGGDDKLVAGQTAVLCVRRGGASLYVEGHLIDASRTVNGGPRGVWGVASQGGRLAIGTRSTTVFHQIEVTEITGAGVQGR